MKCIILAGGRGTRLIPLTDDRPKPLIEIGNMPILYHIIERLRMQGVEEFVIAGGYKWEMIRNYVLNNPIHGVNIRVENTGLESTTGCRLKILASQIPNEKIIVTYGDDISNLDINKVVETHNLRTKFGITITAGRVRSNWGHIKFGNGYKVLELKEKPMFNDWINIGNWVLDSEVCKDIRETETMEQWLARMIYKYKVSAYRYDGFFCGMNTYADYIYLNDLWKKEHDWAKVLQ